MEKDVSLTLGHFVMHTEPSLPQTKQTNSKIIIRGKGSVKEGKIGRKDGQPMPGEDEPLHAFVTGSTQDSVTRAVARVSIHRL